MTVFQNVVSPVIYRYPTMIQIVALGGLVLSVFAIGRKVRGFKPGRGKWIFKGDKYPSHDSLRRGNKAVGPMS
jgi:hypothetical protein